MTDHAYIGRNVLGEAVAVVVDRGDILTADSVAEFIRDGMTIERVTVPWVHRYFGTMAAADTPVEIKETE